MATGKQSHPEREELRPIIAPRRGEFTAWGLTLLVGIIWTVMAFGNSNPPGILLYTIYLLLFFSILISLSGWNDRRTVIRSDPQGITFENGLRKVSLEWDEIQQVQVFSSSWGKRVRVIGDRVFFDFRTLAEVKYKGETRGRMGFPGGDHILNQILAKSDLREIEHSGSGYYYARE